MSKLKISTINVDYVHNLNLQIINPPRAGIILYTKYNNVVYFGLGVDISSHDLTDFGGKRRSNENCLECALREFNEETCDIFAAAISVEDLSPFLVLYNYKNLLIFIHIETDVGFSPHHISELYLSAATEPSIVGSVENCAITWLTLADFRQAYHDRDLMYKKLQKFLSAAPANFYDKL